MSGGGGGGRGGGDGDGGGGGGGGGIGGSGGGVGGGGSNCSLAGYDDEYMYRMVPYKVGGDPLGAVGPWGCGTAGL